jgi:N6-adenosine-specific RNA methylase IME4
MQADGRQEYYPKRIIQHIKFMPPWQYNINDSQYYNNSRKQYNDAAPVAVIGLPVEQQEEAQELNRYHYIEPLVTSYE